MFLETEQTKKARERLASGNPGEVLDAKSMSLIIGAECDSSMDIGWRVVSRCIQWVEKNHELYWRWDRKIKSWRCLVDAEKPDELKQRRTKIRRQAKRSVAIASSCDLGKMDETQRAEVAASVVIAGAIQVLAAGRMMKQLNGKVKEPYLPEQSLLLDALKQRLN